MWDWTTIGLMHGQLMHGKLIFWLREASASKYPFLCRTCFWEEDWYLGIMAKETHWWKVVN